MKKIEYQAPEMEVMKLNIRMDVLLGTSTDEVPEIGGDGKEGEEAG